MNSSRFWGGGQPPGVITEPETAGRDVVYSQLTIAAGI